MLHDELKLIYIPAIKDEGKVVDEWLEVGEKNAKMHFNNDAQHMQSSLIRDIFGGLIRTELHVEGSKHVSVTYEPFFAINLEITKCEELEDCLH